MLIDQVASVIQGTLCLVAFFLSDTLWGTRPVTQCGERSWNFGKWPWVLPLECLDVELLGPAPFLSIFPGVRACAQVCLSWDRTSFLLVGKLQILMVLKTPEVDDPSEQLISTSSPFDVKKPRHPPLIELLSHTFPVSSTAWSLSWNANPRSMHSCVLVLA